MKISEFIRYLEDQKTIHGDIEVVLSKVDCSYYSWNLGNVYDFQVISNGDLVNDIQVNVDGLDKGTKILYYDGGY